jgi:hypothetical protein
MAGMVFFTDNYQDHSTREGYQFEFCCGRCGNGYQSSFQRSLMGFGGQMLRMGGDLLGGAIGGKAQEIGWDSQYMSDGVASPARDKALAKAVDEMKPYFKQCNRCGSAGSAASSGCSAGWTWTSGQRCRRRTRSR